MLESLLKLPVNFQYKHIGESSCSCCPWKEISETITCNLHIEMKSSFDLHNKEVKHFHICYDRKSYRFQFLPPVITYRNISLDRFDETIEEILEEIQKIQSGNK